MDNGQITAFLEEIALLLELKGENPFKVRAYQNAARIIEGLTEPVEKLVLEGRIREIKGIGESIQQKLEEFVTNGKSSYLEELRALFPKELLKLLEIPGLGPKKVKVLYETLGVQNIEQLEKACIEGKVALLPGFGQRTQEKILQGIQIMRQYATRHLLSEAFTIANQFLERLQSNPKVISCSIAGSLRRYKETIGDIDLIAATEDPEYVIDMFVHFPEVEEVIAHGTTKAAVRVKGGIQVDLRVVSEEEYPFALCYFTGSKEHNIVMRQRALQRGLRLNEYGLFKTQEEKLDLSLRIKCCSEKEIYEYLGLQYIPPELREGTGEFEAAEKYQIPTLIEYTDLKGSLHNHSNWSDGRQSLEEIVKQCIQLGFKYWAITDHSRSSFQANGLDEQRLKQQVQIIQDINKRLEDEGLSFRLLAGIEVDILKDRLDFNDDLLAQLDIVVASLHLPSREELENTRRLLMAIQNPYVHIIAHPTGRLLLARESYKVDIKTIIDACSETGTWIELNAHPQRLDLDWRWWPYAKSKGVKCVINSDSHRAQEAEYLRIGTGIARKGWLTIDEVVNTLSLEELKIALARKRRLLKV